MVEVKIPEDLCRAVLRTMVVLPQIKNRMGVLRLPVIMIKVFILSSRWTIAITFTSDQSMRADEA